MEQQVRGSERAAAEQREPPVAPGAGQEGGRPEPGGDRGGQRQGQYVGQPVHGAVHEREQHGHRGEPHVGHHLGPRPDGRPEHGAERPGEGREGRALLP